MFLRNLHFNVIFCGANKNPNKQKFDFYRWYGRITSEEQEDKNQCVCNIVNFFDKIYTAMCIWLLQY